MHIADLPRLSRLLHNSSHLLHQDLCRRILSIHLPICLRNLPSFGYKHPEIRAHTRINETDVGTYRSDLLKSRGVEKDGGCLLLSGNHDTIGSYKRRLMVSKGARGHERDDVELTFDTQRSSPTGNSSKGVFDLHEFTGRREGCKGKAIGLSVYRFRYRCRLRLEITKMDSRVSTTTTGSRHVGRLPRVQGRIWAVIDYLQGVLRYMNCRMWNVKTLFTVELHGQRHQSALSRCNVASVKYVT